MNHSLSLAMVVLLSTACSSGDPATEDADDAALRRGVIAKPVTAETFMSDVRVVNIETLVAEVERSLPGLRRTERTNLCELRGDMQRSKHVAPDGRVRKLVLESGSEDSVHSESYYYDGSGRLRLAARKVHDVKPVVSEDRRYFDETGHEVIWVTRHAIGDVEGRPAPRPDLSRAKFERHTADDLAFDLSSDVRSDPKRAFSSNPVCD